MASCGVLAPVGGARCGATMSVPGQAPARPQADHRHLAVPQQPALRRRGCLVVRLPLLRWRRIAVRGCAAAVSCVAVAILQRLGTLLRRSSVGAVAGLSSAVCCGPAARSWVRCRRPQHSSRLLLIGKHRVQQPLC